MTDESTTLEKLVHVLETVELPPDSGGRFMQSRSRHSRSTTMDIYAQFVPEGQKQAVKQLRSFAERSVPNIPLVFQ